MFVLRCLPLLLACAAGPALACPPLEPAAAAALTLAQALQRVPLCHPDVRAAELAQQGAQADVRIAGQRPNPQLTVGAGAVGRHVGAGTLWSKTFDHQLRIDQTLERGGKPALRVAAAQAGLQAAGAELAAARRDALRDTLHAYVDLAGALAKREQLAASATLTQQAQAALERRVHAGDAPPLDASRFQVDAMRVQADLQQAETDVRTLRLQLATLIGAPEQADALTPVSPWSVDAPATAATDAAATEAALAQRPDVRAAERRRAAAQAQRELALSQRTRDVNVGLQVDRYPTSLSNPSGTGNTVSVTVQVPLFVHHAYEGELLRADADLAAADEQLRRVQLAAREEAARAQAQWQAADARLQLIDGQLLPAAERVAAGAELAYQRGASSVLELLDARRTMRGLRVERIDAEAERAKAAADLRAALGADPLPGVAPAAATPPTTSPVQP